MNLHLALKSLTAASSLASTCVPTASRLLTTSASAPARMADLPPQVRNDPTQQPNAADLVYPRVNVFGEPLQPVPTKGGPTTGFFRNNYADASPLDPGSHCVAAILTPTFLKFSAERGNDLAPLFPKTGPLAPADPSPEHPAGNPAATWAICSSRWAEALRHSKDHPQGEAIVPRVILEATHQRALRDGKIELSDLARFAVGGSGEGASEGGAAAAPAKGERAGR